MKHIHQALIIAVTLHLLAGVILYPGDSVRVGTSRHEMIETTKTEAESAAETKTKTKTKTEADAETATETATGTGAATQTQTATGTGTGTAESSPEFQKVRERILGNLNYPLSLRRRGVHGRAVVEFTVAEDGNLLTARIAASSGSTQLDDEALGAVHRSAPFQEWPGKKTDLLIPIDFEIN